MSASDFAEGGATPRKAAEPRHLFFKGIAGLLLGFPFSLWTSWLLMYTGLGPAVAPARDQVAMWIVIPLWCTVFSIVFLARSRARCVGGLVLANAVVGGLWWVMQ